MLLTKLLHETVDRFLHKTASFLVAEPSLDKKLWTVCLTIELQKKRFERKFIQLTAQTGLNRLLSCSIFHEL